MVTVHCQILSAQAMYKLGTQVGEVLQAGDIIGFSGQLGTGKTQLIKGIAKGLGLANPDTVNSPSYTLVNEYQAALTVYHLDLYRLSEDGDLEDIGFREYAKANGVVLIEWAERLNAYLSELEMHFHLYYASAMTRNVIICGPLFRLQHIRNINEY